MRKTGIGRGWISLLILVLQVMAIMAWAGDPGKGRTGTMTKPVPLVQKIPGPAEVRKPARTGALLPDLVVKQVRIVRDRLQVVLVNQGKGRIPDALLARLRVRVVIGGKARSLGLAPGGTLGRPGGSASCLLRLAPEEKGLQVLVEADAGRVVREANEANNRGIIPASRSSGPSPGAAPGKSMRAATKPARSGGPVPVPVRSVPPQAVIDQVVLVRSTIRVVLRNPSARRLDMNRLRSARLVLAAGTRHGSWSLARFSRLADLARPGGRLMVDTGIRLEAPVRVIVRLEQGGRSLRKVAMLKPPVLRQGTRDESGKDSAPLVRGSQVPVTGTGKGAAGKIGARLRAGTGVVPPPMAHPGPASPQPGQEEERRAALMITGGSLIPEHPRAGQTTVLRLMVRNVGQVETPYPCRVVVERAVAGNGGLEPLPGRTVKVTGAQTPSLPLIKPGRTATLDVAMVIPDPGHYLLLCRLFTFPDRPLPPGTAQVRRAGEGLTLPLFVDPATSEPGAQAVDLVLEDLRRNEQGRLVLVMRNRSVSSAVRVPEAAFAASLVQVVIHHPGRADRTVLLSLTTADPNGLLRAALPPSVMQAVVSFVWPTRDAAHPNGISPDELEGSTVEAIINTNGSIREYDQGNNRLQRSFSLGDGAAPDLVVCVPKIFKVQTGVEYALPIAVWNRGAAPAVSTRLQMQVLRGGDVPVTTLYEVPALEPGESRMVTELHSTMREAGTMRYLLRLDANDTVDEGVAGERNNVIRAAVVGDGSPHPEEYLAYQIRYQRICSDHPEAAVPVP